MILRIATIFVFLVCPVLAGAAPFLVCDPYGPGSLQPTAFQVTVNGKTERVAPTKHPNGGVYLHYDMKDLGDGEHQLKVKAINEIRKTESGELEYRFRKTGENWSPVAPEKEKIQPSRSYPSHRNQ
jgi:hypothetical protein